MNDQVKNRNDMVLSIFDRISDFKEYFDQLDDEISKRTLAVILDTQMSYLSNLDEKSLKIFNKSIAEILKEVCEIFIGLKDLGITIIGCENSKDAYSYVKANGEEKEYFPIFRIVEAVNKDDYILHLKILRNRIAGAKPDFTPNKLWIFIKYLYLIQKDEVKSCWDWSYIDATPKYEFN